MMTQQDIKWIQVEATSKCNAWCPSCLRNKDGFGLASGYEVQDLDLERFEFVISQFPNLQVIHFCGTYGDAIAATHIKKMVTIAKKYCKKIQLNTNGSLRNKEWWESFAHILSDIEHDVWFCLDGLKEVHEIYRQGTNFDTIIANATAFIQAGGSATWQFIPFSHNQHQITDCIRLSQQLGFKKFKYIKDVVIPQTPRHYRTGQTIEILPWSRDSAHNKWSRQNQHVPAHACQHLSQPSIYLNSNGTINYCCYFNLYHSVDSFDQLGEPDINHNRICLNSCGVPGA